MTARTLAAAAATVFGVAFLSAGLAYFIAGCLLAWWLLVDLSDEVTLTAIEAEQTLRAPHPPADDARRG